jgi:hypothetical protein
MAPTPLPTQITSKPASSHQYPKNLIALSGKKSKSEKSSEKQKKSHGSDSEDSQGFRRIDDSD